MFYLILYTFCWIQFTSSHILSKDTKEKYLHKHQCHRTKMDDFKRIHWYRKTNLVHITQYYFF